MTKPHAYAIEVLNNPGSRTERWTLDTENGTWPDFDGADHERDAYIKSGYVPEQVRVVAMIAVDQSIGEEEPEEEDVSKFHRRFSYGLDKGPHEECPGSWNDGECVHECDLPKVHITRHQCGMCGRMF